MGLLQQPRRRASGTAAPAPYWRILQGKRPVDLKLFPASSTVSWQCCALSVYTRGGCRGAKDGGREQRSAARGG